MFKRFFQWLKYWPNPIPQPLAEAPDNRMRRGIFSTQLERTSGLRMADRVYDTLAALGEQHPVARLEGTMDSADGAADIALKSSYVNAQPAVSDAVVGYFLAQGFIGHQLAGLLAQHWLIDKCCLLPARDATRKWFEIHTADGQDIDAPEVLNMMKRLDKRFKLAANLREWVHKGKVFGVRIAILKVKSTDPKYYEYPFNLDAVTPGSYEGIVQVDPYWCSPELDLRSSTNPDTEHFYEPTFWLINGKRYHRTHLCIYREGDVADILKPSYQYGGIPVPQKIMERVYAAERTANEAPQLAMTKRTTYIGTDMEGVVLGGPEVLERFEQMAEYENNYAKNVLDKDDVVQQFDVALADFDSLMMNQYQLVAAEANVPGTKLLGTQPKGFSATGEYDEAMYHEELESIQSDKLTEFVDRHHQLVMISCIVPAMRRTDPDFEPITTSVNWLPLDSPTAKEVAEINKLKADTALVLVNAGAIDGYDERDRIRLDKASDYHGIPEALRPDDDGDGEPDAAKVGQPPVPAGAAMGFDAEEVQLITNQMYLDPAVVAQKQADQDYKVQVSVPLPDPETGRMYRIILDGHHSLEAARIDGVAPEFEEGNYGDSDYFDADDGSPLAR